MARQNNEATTTAVCLSREEMRDLCGTPYATKQTELRQLGHTTVAMTEHYTRQLRGQKTTPTR